MRGWFRDAFAQTTSSTGTKGIKPSTESGHSTTTRKNAVTKTASSSSSSDLSLTKPLKPSDDAQLSLTHPSSLGVLLVPARVAKLSLLAVGLGEILDRAGILHEDTPEVLRSQFYKVWYDVQPQVSRWVERIGEALELDSLQQHLAVKYQFAVGAGIGMLAAPLFTSMATLLWQPALLLCGLAEWTKGRSLLQSGLGSKLDAVLDAVHRGVHRCWPDPSAFSSFSLIETSGGSGKTRGYTLGLSSTLAVETKPTEQRALTVSQPSPQNHRQAHPVMQIFRHGVLVGGALGLLLKI